MKLAAWPSGIYQYLQGQLLLGSSGGEFPVGKSVEGLSAAVVVAEVGSVRCHIRVSHYRWLL